MEAVERVAEGERLIGAGKRRRARPTEEILPDPPETISEDERKIEGLIASKRAQALALEAEYEEWKRVRAHLDGLMAHNLTTLDRVGEELKELEGMREQLRRIRTTIEHG